MTWSRSACWIALPALSLLIGLPGSHPGQARAADPATPDSGVVQAAPPPPSAPKQKRVYYGGTLVLGFGNPDHFGFWPSVGYKLTPRMSIGAEIGYEYLKYDGIKEGFNNYGGSLFSRFKLTPRLYGHAEYQAISTELLNQFGDSDRAVVPYLLLGGGFIQPISPAASAYVEILFDVLQDENSPYDSGEPFISFGVGVGF